MISQSSLQRSSLFTLCRAIVRNYIHYDDILYESVFNVPFNIKLEEVHYDVWLPKSSLIRGDSREKF